MQCPKCGASQPVTNKECPSCGIIFDRWQPRASRRTTSSSTPIPPPAALPIVDPESGAPKISNALVAVGLGILLIIGFIWTKHSRDSRPKTSGIDETINQINNSGSKLRGDLQNRTNLGGKAVKASAVWSPQKLPADLDEAKIRDIIESCSYFLNDVNIDIPKRLDGR